MKATVLSLIIAMSQAGVAYSQSQSGVERVDLVEGVDLVEKVEEVDLVERVEADSLIDTYLLKEVKVQAPSKTRMKDGAMITRVVASSLSKVGNAEDVMVRIPGMMKMQGELQVIGKGAPTYYINGRKVSDATELQRLSSEDIKDVEVISTPGAQYDAQTNAVVRIRTIRQKGEGFGVSLDVKDEVAPSCGNNTVASTVNVTYRHNNIDVFGGFSADNNHLSRYATDVSQSTFGVNNLSQSGSTLMSQQYNSIKFNLGMNWQLAETHSVGFKVERNDNLKGITDFNMKEAVKRNDVVVDNLSSDTHTDADGLDSWLGNVYYSGQVGKLGVEWNGDFYRTSQKESAVTSESADNGMKSVVSHSDAVNRMLATKLVLSHPIGMGKLQVGTEMTFVKRDNDYAITENSIADDESEVKENTYALFAEYGTMIPKAGMLNMGIRYEHVDFSYNSHCNPAGNLTRHTDDIFPFVSFATKVGEIEGSLAYTVRIKRPNYRVLRNNIEYNNRFTLSTGNPTLRSEIRHEVGLNARWRWLGLSANYNYMKHGIYDWTYPYDENGTVLISWVNFNKPINAVSAYINAAPTFGIWQPSYTAGIQKQWLTFTLNDPRTTSGMRDVSYNRPMFIFNANNTFRFGANREDNTGAWQAELNSEFLSGAHFGNAELRNCYWNLTVALQKSFLKDDALSLRLAFSDIFHTAYHNVRIDLGNYVLTQSHILGQGRDVYDLQRISLSARYKFNAAKSKYKGSGAGNSSRERM